jgi:hypothetical protein
MWYLRDELMLIKYDEARNQGTWLGFMWARPIPGLNRFSIITAVWIIDKIGPAPCLMEEYLGVSQ